ncbi:alcohol dehydrogenase catalytic domain-containing protein [Noviherbaspirillum sedimenti]|uniref:S-(Hydroxymethyl)glutathione dehydrogenase n=1 Tax=Noviherbaspirillum sedimenti TaxID=2320865 RepID=A0A3A3GEJ2_9BURK|nr:zinc-binding dehydrogenase [Noviherbaspirillum sedimenti]RJG00656.1 S-(hydroxymethyl)glutathione dehydrogenase [Noviherbaspirillum sedimenti]
MPVTCKAAVAFGPNEPLQIRVIEVADPGPKEVMVRLAATGLCHSDLSMMEGKGNVTFPIVFGHEGFGEVVACGEGVTEFEVGDTVIPYLIPDCGECFFCKSGRTNLCVQFGARRQSPWTPFSLDGKPIATFMGLGTFAEITVVKEDMLTKVDSKAPADYACCIGCGVTTGIGAALNTAQVKPGSTVGVFGVGGVGLSVVQGARLAGAGRIIAIDMNPAKEEVARRMGATDFVNAKEVDNLVSHLFQMTGMGLDYAFECVGSPKLMALALEATNPAWGLAVNIGVVEAGKELTTLPNTLVTGRRWTGSLMGGAKRQDVSRYVDMFMRGEIKLDDLVSHRLDLEEINHGFDMMRSGESVRSVIMY